MSRFILSIVTVVFGLAQARAEPTFELQVNYLIQESTYEIWGSKSGVAAEVLTPWDPIVGEYTQRLAVCQELIGDLPPFLVTRPLNVVLCGGFVPSAGDGFELLLAKPYRWHEDSPLVGPVGIWYHPHKARVDFSQAELPETLQWSYSMRGDGVTVTVIPEPSDWLMLLTCGVIGLLAYACRGRSH